MSDEWNVYLSEREEAPASILLDVGIARESVREAYPEMTWVRLNMLSPAPDGLSSEEEFDDLRAIFDALETAAAASSSIVVGRKTGSGVQDIFLYTADGPAMHGAIRDVMRGFPTYVYESGVRADPEWSVYFDVLYPSPREQQTIGNRSVCENLRRHGDDLQTPRLVDHCAYFGDEVRRARFAGHIQKQGFRVTDQFATEEPSPRFALVFSQLAVPARIDDYVLPVFDDVVEFGGEYDGWETVLIKSSGAGDTQGR